ncbi:endonuclease/exonuclease/phosphatase family metal-dependent hydrolase [Peribacillus deserti]|uniref:Endonuclease/exonuclease/phosphatase family metal-dependent hydrolase n=1 Tax=Peribacillus deserti TaxID=673318 RepID=A0ABS2QEP3_9BACI|nr:endonuclease/exonuclease/phosphatase family protein [Peribacillus deserti]MBM7691174.1 endonuclease/exonuclease/phosphatase family metal-dependent hydrolase [Peribacillus deserti]
MEIKVMTFNIHHGKGTDKKQELDRILEVIKSVKADIIGLNEVDKFFSNRSKFIDQTKYLARALQMNYAYGPAITIEDRVNNRQKQYGNALLTRFPIIHSTNHPFDFLPKIIEDRSLLEVTIKAEEQNITAYVAHLSFAPLLHKRQTSFILNQMKQKDSPCFVMGDWNMNRRSKSWKLVTNTLKDAWLEANPSSQGGHTYPSKKPRMGLDYIFINKGFNAVESSVINKNAAASDHLPVTATLKLLSP